MRKLSLKEKACQASKRANIPLCAECFSKGEQYFEKGYIAGAKMMRRKMSKHSAPIYRPYLGLTKGDIFLTHKSNEEKWDGADGH